MVLFLLCWINHDTEKPNQRNENSAKNLVLGYIGLVGRAMKISELINHLEESKEVNGDLYVYYSDGENGDAPVETIEKRESYAPSGIPFLLLRRIQGT